jgi:hypothetical protein
MVVMLVGLGHLRSDVGFLVLIESQARCVRGLKLLREQILYDKKMVRSLLAMRRGPFQLASNLDELILGCSTISA